MAFITFFYKIGNHPKMYCGKYACDYISHDHDGLDIIVKSALINGINKYRAKKNLPKLKTRVNVGVMSFSADRYIPTYSTKSEKSFFDFYYTEYKYVCKTYVNGKLME
jgi:hypothetical protein